MIERISFLIALVLVSGCAPDKYIVRNVDTDYLLNQINPEQLACIGSIPINLANEIPYGLQESVDQRTKEPDPLVLVDSRAVIGGLIRSAGEFRGQCTYLTDIHFHILPMKPVDIAENIPHAGVISRRSCNIGQDETDSRAGISPSRHTTRQPEATDLLLCS